MVEAKTPTPTAPANPLTTVLEEKFANEEESQEALSFPGKERDQGKSIPAAAGIVNVTPTGYASELRKPSKGRTRMEDFVARPSSFEVWSFDGAPSEIPIAYEAGGGNPSISRYLRKKHCNACGFNGFVTLYCTICNSEDVIKYYYVRYAEVPEPRNWYGAVPCLCSRDGQMEGDCPRDGIERNGTHTGFLSPQQMLMHASSKHAREYGIWQQLRATGGLTATAKEPAFDVERLRAEITAQILEELTVPGAEQEPAKT